MTRPQSPLSVLKHCFAFAAAAALSMSAPAFASPPSGGGGGQSQSDDGRRRSLTSSTSYLPLPQLMATVQADYRSAGLLQIEMGLEISDSRLRRRAEHMMPRLRDAYVSAISLYVGMNYRYGDVPDANRIAELLQNATNHTLGQDGARVLLGMVMIHAD
jgi:hypothetical protein